MCRSRLRAQELQDQVRDFSHFARFLCSPLVYRNRSSGASEQIVNWGSVLDFARRKGKQSYIDQETRCLEKLDTNAVTSFHIRSALFTESKTRSPIWTCWRSCIADPVRNWPLVRETSCFWKRKFGLARGRDYSVEIGVGVKLVSRMRRHWH